MDRSKCHDLALNIATVQKSAKKQAGSVHRNPPALTKELQTLDGDHGPPFSTQPS